MTDNEKILLSILAAILEMSDRVEAAGGCGCIAGIASANALQKSIQKNKPRIMAVVEKLK